MGHGKRVDFYVHESIETVRSLIGKIEGACRRVEYYYVH
jgi:hypothetical protein